MLFAIPSGCRRPSFVGGPYEKLAQYLEVGPGKLPDVPLEHRRQGG
jgi:hypothetical protein